MIVINQLKVTDRQTDRGHYLHRTVKCMPTLLRDLESRGMLT